MSEKQTKAQAAEAAAIRRRWITLGEIVAVAALIISGLTFWNSYSERTASEAERAAEKAAAAEAEQDAAERSQTLLLRAHVIGGGTSLALAPADSGQVIQSQTLIFPKALGVGSIEAVIEPRIEARWIDEAVEEMDRSGSAGGDLRLPVAITTRFVSDGETYSDTTLYDVGYRLDNGILDTDVELIGLSRIERTQPSAAQARLDAIWKSRQ
ncbi:hypothetical protein [Allosphingosinicella sp.]|uniref:hypothetical protein n=1 Tax=Allosphingosinicella sp. TaxID=2823234 RepID=UPI002FC1A5CF